MSKRALTSFRGAAGVCMALAVSMSVSAQESVEERPSLEQEVVALKAELERVKGMLPAQAVAMTVVEYNFSNLWFAAHERNWPLAKFFLSETRARLRWALRISPQRRVSSGFVELQPFLDAFEQPHYAALERSLEDGDVAAFERAYEGGLGACESCHAASEKPYLRVEIPSVPAGALIEFDAE